jgi:hypothetical protein
MFLPNKAFSLTEPLAAFGDVIMRTPPFDKRLLMILIAAYGFEDICKTLFKIIISNLNDVQSPSIKP